LTSAGIRGVCGGLAGQTKTTFGGWDQPHRHAAYTLLDLWTTALPHSQSAEWNSVRLCMQCCGEHAVKTDNSGLHSPPFIHISPRRSCCRSGKVGRPLFILASYYFGTGTTSLTWAKSLSGMHRLLDADKTSHESV